MKLRWQIALAMGLLHSGIEAHSKSTWIHAAGIKSGSSSSSNLPTTWWETTEFVKACKRNGMQMGTDCKLFLNTSVPVPKGIPSATPAESLGPPKKTTVLNALKEALIQAGKGDRVVFSLDGHGMHGFVSGDSCVAIESGEKICADDVEAILSAHRKPGTKVFLHVDSCFAGAYHKFSNREVCAFTSSSEHKGGDDRGAQMWRQANIIAAQMPTGSPLTLADVRRRGAFPYAHRDDGGFSSEYHKRIACRKDAQRQPLSEDKLPFIFTLRSLQKGYLSMLPAALPDCTKTMDEKAILSAIASYAKVLDTLSSTTRHLQSVKSKHCGANRNPALCRSIDAFQKMEPEYQRFRDGLADILEHHRIEREKLYQLDADIQTELRELELPDEPKARRLFAQQGRLLEKRELLDEKFHALVADFFRSSDDFFELTALIQDVSDQLCLPDYDHNSDTKLKFLSPNYVFGTLIFGSDPAASPGQIEDSQKCEQDFLL